MINIVKIMGGLGNQMFDYAFFLALKKNNPYALNLIQVDSTVNKHFGFELFKIFNISDTLRLHFGSLLDHESIYRLMSFKKITQENAIEYNHQLINNKKGNYLYDGYWQSELYFKKIEYLIREIFTFRDNLISEKNRIFTSSIINQESVSIHIRRGDYLKENGWNISNSNYYQNAIKTINNHISNPVYYFFSDDIEWCKSNFRGENYFFIDWNNKTNSWQDLYLMTKCKHNIIANSTFSWWGAWLNANPNKKVLAPSIWFPNMQNSDIIPSNWIKVLI